MKLRQKLAVVLASAMVVTAVPVVTMAASTNSLTHETLKVKKDNIFEPSTAPGVKVNFKDNQGADEVFYLQLTNAEWNSYADGYTEGAFTYSKQSDTVVKVTVDKTKADYSKAITFPILAKATGGDATVEIVTMGGSTTVSKGSFVFATTSEKKVSYKVGDLPSFFTGGDIAPITLEESYKDALKNAGKVEITLELTDGDWTFQNLDAIKVEGAYGFTKDALSVSAAYPSTSDKGVIKVTVTLKDGVNPATIGTAKLTGINVKSTVKAPEEGKLLLDIKGDDLVATGADVAVAEVAKYGTYLTMADDKAVEIIAGRKEDVKFTIGETVEDSIVGGREFEIKLDAGHFDYKTLLKDYGVKGDTLVKDAAGKDITDKYESVELKVADLYKKEIITDATFKLNDVDTKVIERVYFDQDADGEIIKDTLIVELHKGAQINKNKDKMTFKLPVCVPVDKKETESIKVTASGRALENEVSATAVTVKNPFDVTFEQAVLKVGLQGQVSGSVTLTEKDKEMFQKGGKITFKIKNKDEAVGIYLTDVKVDVSAGLKGTEDSTTKGKDGSVTVTLNRASKEASTITLKDMKFTTDRVVPEGTYDLEISGTGIDADGHTIKIEDFIKISTANTEDITANGLAKGTASFVIGESKYTANGKEVAMDAASYIQDPGYTMVPVRYVANAFGVAESDILFGKGTVTIFAGNRTIALTAGSDTAIVNGAPVTLATKVVIKEGRTYAPISEIAKILGVSSKWDSATKTASFENK